MTKNLAGVDLDIGGYKDAAGGKTGVLDGPAVLDCSGSEWPPSSGTSSTPTTSVICPLLHIA